jgi:CheY-like chemotaxis protein
MADARSISGESSRRKHFLFVDDDPAFLGATSRLLADKSKGSWEVHTAESHAQALSLLQKQRMDVVVLDIGMPVMDGLQFLRLLGRTHPGQQVVMLTGLATDANRSAALEGGAALFLEKPASPKAFDGVYAALDALADAMPQEGFRGVMRRVGLQEVLQMECLGRKSSVIEIFTAKVRGRIFISDGAIIHAESGTLQGEVALYSLLALRGGEFNLSAFSEPARRTISGQWEFLLMEAARLHDEAASQAPAGPGGDTSMDSIRGTGRARIEEIVMSSSAGEVLYDWDCKSLESRLKLLEELDRQGERLAAMAPLGRLDRLEVLTRDGRIICQLQTQMRLFVRSARSKGI